MLISLQGDGPVSLRLYRGLRSVILDRRLAAGMQVPSMRELAAELRVSRKAVARAFQRLAEEGYVETRVGAGTFVVTVLPDPSLQLQKPLRSRVPGTAPMRLSSYASRVMAQLPWPPQGVRTPSLYDFHYGTPAIADFPDTVWSRLVAKKSRHLSLGMLRYGPTKGHFPLRRAIASYLARARGVSADPKQVLIVNGSQQAVDLVTRLLIDSGDTVAVEEPGYQFARHTFEAAGARLHPVRVDRDGLSVSELPEHDGVRLIHVTPSHQFPLGAVLPRSRRIALLEWARRRGAYIIENDYDCEFRYTESAEAAIQSLDQDGRVLYMGSFSKVLCPSLRLAYLVLPARFVRPSAALKFLMDFHTATFEQSVMAEFIADGHFERHIRKARTRNAARRQALLAAVEKHLGDRADIVGANAGVHVVMWLRDIAASHVDVLRRRAAEAGVSVYPVAPCYVHAPTQAGLLLGYASLSEADIESGIALFAKVLKRFRVTA